MASIHKVRRAEPLVDFEVEVAPCRTVRGGRGALPTTFWRWTIMLPQEGRVLTSVREFTEHEVALRHAKQTLGRMGLLVEDA